MIFIKSILSKIIKLIFLGFTTTEINLVNLDIIPLHDASIYRYLDVVEESSITDNECKTSLDVAQNDELK
jgi:hypothetical protein